MKYFILFQFVLINLNKTLFAKKVTELKWSLLQQLSFSR